MYSIKNNNQGFILVTLPFVLLMLLGLIALVVDSTRLYVTQQEIQSAADAAAISGMMARISETNPTIIEQLSGSNEERRQVEESYIIDRARKALRNGLLERGITPYVSNDEELLKYSRRMMADFDQDDQDIIKLVDEGVSGSLTLSANPEVEVATLLMDVVRTFHKSEDTTENGQSEPINKAGSVHARSSVKIKPANIVFIADLSDSSLCPEAGDCDCNNQDRFGEPLIGEDGEPVTNEDGELVLNEVSCFEEARVRNMEQKYEKIREAFLEFVNGFDDTRDRISLVFYNNVAWVPVPFRTEGGTAELGYNREEFVEAFNQVGDPDDEDRDAGLPDIEFIPRGDTNISDALLTAIEEAERVNLVSQGEEVSYILLSDGAPTGARIIPEGLNEDVLNFSAVWNDTVVENEVETFVTYAGPGPFIRTDLYKQEYQNESNTGFRNAAPISPNLGDWFRVAEGEEFEDGTYEILGDPEVLPVSWGSENQATTNLPLLSECNSSIETVLELASNPQHNGETYDVSRIAGALSECLQADWSFQLPCPEGIVCEDKVLGSEFDLARSVHPDEVELNFEKIYYIAALEAANLLRANKGRIFTVGYGQNKAIDNDPFQGDEDGSGLKSVFLTNLANSFHQAFKVNDDGTKVPFHPEFSYEGYNNFESRREQKQSTGSYYEAPDSTSLKESLAQIAKEIKLSLLE